jgi:metal-dependent HD superfamily phosphatase/phosphodiesterase
LAHHFYDSSALKPKGRSRTRYVASARDIAKPIASFDSIGFIALAPGVLAVAKLLHDVGRKVHEDQAFINLNIKAKVNFI